MTGPSCWLVDQLSRVDANRRRLWAARLLLWSMAGWAVSHIGLELLPQWFFEHVLMAISWGAMVLTAVDIVQTSDVKVDTSEEN